jgi:hypothetical protein
MRAQMFETMKALQEGARAFVTATNDADRVQANLIERAFGQAFFDVFNNHTFASFPLIDGVRPCLGCGHEQFYENGRRLWNDARDTCTCATRGEDNLEPHRAVRKQHFLARPKVCACNDPSQPGPHVISDKPDRFCGCPSCHGGIEGAACRCPPKDRPASTAPTQADAEKMRRAIALLTMKVFTKKEPFGESITEHRIYGLLGVRPCENCRGTAWVARDEMCNECGRAGFLKA